VIETCITLEKVLHIHQVESRRSVHITTRGMYRVRCARETGASETGVDQRTAGYIKPGK